MLDHRALSPPMTDRIPSSLSSSRTSSACPISARKDTRKVHAQSRQEDKKRRATEGVQYPSSEVPIQHEEGACIEKEKEASNCREGGQYLCFWGPLNGMKVPGTRIVKDIVKDKVGKIVKQRQRYTVPFGGGYVLRRRLTNAFENTHKWYDTT